MDLRAHLEQTGRGFDLAPDGSDFLRCRYVHADADSTIAMAMRRLPLPNGRQWLGIGILLCPLARIRPRGALVANAELPIGALALLQDDIVLRQTLPFNALPVAVFERTLHGLAATFLELLAARARVARDPERETPYGYVFR